MIGLVSFRCGVLAEPWSAPRSTVQVSRDSAQRGQATQTRRAICRAPVYQQDGNMPRLIIQVGPTGEKIWLVARWTKVNE